MTSISSTRTPALPFNSCGGGTHFLVAATLKPFNSGHLAAWLSEVDNLKPNFFSDSGSSSKCFHGSEKAIQRWFLARLLV